MDPERPWYDDDGLWADVEPVIFDSRRWAEAPGECDAVTALGGLSPGARVLDLACGPGRHAVELARRGHRVTGVDRTPRYLATAARHAAAAGVSVELVHADMRDFRRDGVFDAAINLFTSFGYFDDPADDLRVAANVRASLRPGGTFVLETMGREVLVRHHRLRDWVESDGLVILEECRFASTWSRVDYRWIVLDGAVRRERTFTYRVYSGAELRALLLSAGFRTVTLHGDLDGEPYDGGATRLVAVAVR